MSVQFVFCVCKIFFMCAIMQTLDLFADYVCAYV